MGILFPGTGTILTIAPVGEHLIAAGGGGLNLQLRGTSVHGIHFQDTVTALQFVDL